MQRSVPHRWGSYKGPQAGEGTEAGVKKPRSPKWETRQPFCHKLALTLKSVFTEGHSGFTLATNTKYLTHTPCAGSQISLLGASILMLIMNLASPISIHQVLVFESRHPTCVPWVRRKGLQELTQLLTRFYTQLLASLATTDL